MGLFEVTELLNGRGNSEEMCGGSLRMGLFSKKYLFVFAPFTAVITCNCGVVI